ncbi:MAG: MarR family transcriptional regulator [Methanobacteriota archaeon]|nr:MAG: MarR family transcriptional regulator [Euryarchaeota archaeon]
MNLELSALEIRIVKFLGENYPVTVDDIRRGLSVRRDTLARALKSLVTKGIVELEPLPDKTYVRLLAHGIIADASPLRGSAADRAEETDDSFMYM